MDVYEALYTTRAMRRCKPDPIPIDVQQRILDAAMRAPSGGNTQNWRFMLVDDADVKAQLGPIYRECMTQLWATIYKERLDAANADPDDPENAQMLRIQRSAQHLADHFEEYPLLLFSFVQFDPTGGSIFPATWSAMLAARAEGVGASLTSVFMFQIDQVLEILGVPTTKAGCSRRASRSATRRVSGVSRPAVRCTRSRSATVGATPLGFEIPEPLWP